MSEFIYKYNFAGSSRANCMKQLFKDIARFYKVYLLLPIGCRSNYLVLHSLQFQRKITFTFTITLKSYYMLVFTLFFFTSVIYLFFK